MKVVITGAKGLVGKELTRQLLDANQEVLPLAHEDLDITDETSLRKIIFAECPSIVINCAVIGVETCKDYPNLARQINVTGVENLAKAAAKTDCEFMHLSTNYVFDGRRNFDAEFYTIEDFPEPINFYGKTKLEGERRALAACEKCYIVRTSWIFGKDKENFFSMTPELLRRGKKVSAAADTFAGTTYVSDLVSRIIEIIRLKNYSTYHIVNAGKCSRYDFAIEAGRILKISEAELKNLIEPLENFTQKNYAARPQYTPMRCLESEKLGLAPMRNWKTALAEFIAKI